MLIIKACHLFVNGFRGKKTGFFRKYKGNFPNEREMIQQTIESFEKSLPDYLKGLEGSHDFIIKKIDEIDKKIAKIKNGRNVKNKNYRDTEQER